MITSMADGLSECMEDTWTHHEEVVVDVGRVVAGLGSREVELTDGIGTPHSTVLSP